MLLHSRKDTKLFGGFFVCMALKRGYRLLATLFSIELQLNCVNFTRITLIINDKSNFLLKNTGFWLDWWPEWRFAQNYQRV